MSFGSNVRIDDFCLPISNVTVEDNKHIGALTGLYASESSITIKNLTTLSSNVTVCTASDEHFASALVPKEKAYFVSSDIIIDKYVIVGTGSCILPGAIISEGTSVGAMSLVKSELLPWSTYAGVLCKKIKDRSKKMLECLSLNLK